MGDPISTFGVAAGAIQLTDLALRASREAYGFLSAVKDSERDVRNLKDTLRDVDSNVRSLREYVSRFSKSKASKNEFEVLPEAITGCLIRFHDDMITLKQLLPYKDSPSFIDKVKWVYDKRKIDTVGKRLHERRADIALAMSMVGRLHDLHARESHSEFKRSFESSYTSLSREVGTLASEVQRHNLEQHRNLQNVHDELDNTQQTLKSIESGMYDLRYRSDMSSPNADELPRVLRAELISFFQPLMDQTLTKSDVINETRMQRLEEKIDRLSTIIGRDLNNNDCTQAESLHQTANSIAPHYETFDRQWDDKWSEPDIINGQSQCLLLSGCDFGERSVWMTSTQRNSWSLKLPFGNIGIKTETKTRRMHGSIRCTSYLSLHLHFRPSKSFVFIPGISIFYGHTLRNTGHITLSASINFHKIIPYDHPVWEIIRKDDVSALQQMIQFGSVDLGAEFPNGYKLLHFAALLSKPSMCKFLSSYDQGWNDSENRLNLTATSLVTIGFLLPLNVFDNYTTYRQNRAQIIAHLRQDNVKQAFQQWFPRTYFDGGNIFVAFQNERAHYFSDLYKVIGDEIGHFVNTVAYRGGWDLYGPSVCSLEIVSEMIDHGLNPNLDIKANHYSIPSLYVAIRLMHCTNNFNGSVQGEGYDGTDGKERRNAETSKSGPQHSSDADDQVTPWCIVVALIQAGADIHHMVPWTIEGAQRWTDIQTPWWLASQLGKSDYWREALFEYGLDPISTWREDMKRRKQALRLRGAWRSGIDEQILDLPPSAGLRNRWCYRKYHSCGAIGYQAEWH